MIAIHPIIVKIEETINNLHEMTSEIPKRLKMIEQELSLCDLEKNDLLHLMEFNRLNAAEGARYSKELHITLNKRRELKDEYDELRSVLDNLNKSRTAKELATSIKKSKEDRVKIKSEKFYTPRVRTDLAGWFKCNKKNM